MKRTWVYVSLLVVLLFAACTPAAPASTAAPTAASGSAPAQPAVEASPTAEAAPATAAAPELPEGGTVTRALTSEPTSLDPQGAASSGQNVLLPYLLDTLVYRDLDNTFKPFLAESWELSDEGKVVTFKLREGVTFHDGSPLNADAVVFTFNRFKEVGAKSPIYGGISEIKSVEAVDKLTVRFTFEAPSSTFLGTVSMPYAGIISPAAGTDLTQTLVGTGPFKLGEWKPGVSITLERNPDYNWASPAVENRGPVHIDRAVFPVIPDASAQFNAMLAGEVDVIFVNNPEQIQKLSANTGVAVHESVLNSLVYLAFNFKSAPFDDLKVRQALSHAINKQEIVDVALAGLGNVAFAPLAATLPGFDPSLQSYELGYDPEQAKALLAEAGFTQEGDGWTRDGKPFKAVLLTSTRAPNGNIATLVQSQLQAVGVPLEIKQLETQAAMEAAAKGEFDIMLWRYDWNDADVLNIYLSSSRIGRTNRSAYSNPEVDGLLAQASHELDADARNALYLEAQKLIMADAPWQPLYSPKDVTAVSARLTGVVFGPMGRLLLNDVRVQP